MSCRHTDGRLLCSIWALDERGVESAVRCANDQQVNNLGDVLKLDQFT